MRNREIGLDGCWGTMSGNCADLNNDGHLDLLLGGGGSRMDRQEPLILLENDGAKFRNITFAAGLPFTGKNHGVNCADLFGDGRLSILVAGGGMYPADLLASSVFCPTERRGQLPECAAHRHQEQSRRHRRPHHAPRRRRQADARGHAAAPTSAACPSSSTSAWVN